MSASTSLLFDLPTCTIRRAVVSEMANNAYLITHKRSGEQVLIDAADDVAALAGLLREGAADTDAPAVLVLVATTHQHWDHIRALAQLVAETGANTAAGAADVAGIAAGCGVAIERPLFDGERLTVAGGALALDCVALRGHTPGSIAFVLGGGDEQPPLIFSGDSLFPGGVGNTGGDAERFATLLQDVSERLFARYPDAAIVLPGHGDATTLGAERPALPQWRERGW